MRAPRLRRFGVLGLALIGSAGALVRGAERVDPGTTERVRALSASALSVRTAAAVALIEDRVAEAHPALLEALMDDDALDHAVAARGLYARPRAASDAPALLRGLTHDTKARVPAAWELSRVGPTDDTVIASALIAALGHPDKHERNFVVVALALSGVQGGDAVTALLRILNNPGADDSPQQNYRFPRASAAIALGLIGPGAREAVPALVQLLDEQVGAWEYQRAANCFALGRIGAEAKSALPTLMNIERDPSSAVRAQAARAVRAIETSGTANSGALLENEVGELIAVIAGGASRMSPKFVAGLRALGEFAGKAKPMPRKGARRGAPAVHESVALAIGYLDSLNRPPTPDEIAPQDKAGALSNETRLYIMALGGVQQGITATLLVALEQGEMDPRVAAIRRLGMMRPATIEAVSTLRAAARDDLDWMVRREAYLALQRFEAKP